MHIVFGSQSWWKAWRNLIIPCYFCYQNQQAASCYGCLFYSISAKGWVALELRTLYTEKFVELFDDLRYAFIDEDGHGPTVGEMVIFLCYCPVLCQREKILTMFRIGCL